MKKLLFIVLSVVTAGLVALSGCSSQKSEETKANGAVAAPTADFNVKASSKNKVSNADTFITLNGSSAKIKGDGADFNGKDILISKGGSYAVSGTLKNGRIVVKAGSGDVNVILNGADITSNYSSAFLVKKAAKVTLTAYEGSVNILRDAAEYDYNDDYSDIDEAEPDACIYSEEDLLLNGKGQLLVQGNCKNGVTGKNILNIEKMNLTVYATGHGVTGKEALLLKNVAFNVTSGRDALRANSTEQGTVTVIDCEGKISSGEDGIQAESKLTIESGNYSIVSGGGCQEKSDADLSTKALKGVSAVQINGGTISADSLDDAIHSNGNVNIAGGNLTLKSGDDAIHADQDVTISGGTISAEYCYEGLEATNVTLSGGDVKLTAFDDGINISGGNDEAETDFFGGSGGKLSVTGGKLYVNAEGDGLDANGDIEISGGSTVINGPTKGGNGVVDYDGEFLITGGEFIAVGPSSMAQSPSDKSTQNVLIFTDFSGSEKETFSISASDGTKILNHSSIKNFNWVCYSSPKIKKGETYTAYLSENKIAEIKVEEILNSNGALNNGGPGNFGGPGGGPEGGPGGPRPDKMPYRGNEKPDFSPLKF